MPIITNPQDIQAKSFKIVDQYLKKVKLPGLEKEILKRVLHATSDIKYVRDFVFHPKSLKEGLAAIKKGKNIVVDAGMVKAGINKKLLTGFGGKIICFINQRDIARQASSLNITRSILSMRKAHKLMDGGIVAIGNAPTALFEVCDLVSQDKAVPALIIGLPVGFVGAKEAKRKLRSLKIPYITNCSRYGGSSAAAACVNALLKMAERARRHNVAVDGGIRQLQ